MKTTMLLLLSLASLAGSQKPPKSAAAFCTPEGGKGSVRCGGAQYAACIQIHPDNEEGSGVCQTEDVLPSCCAASPDSADRTAKTCACCQGRKKAAITIPYDPI